MMRYFYDTEFIEDGKTIDLISIGIVCEDGRELYLQSMEFDASKASDWVKENVFPHLARCAHRHVNPLFHELKVHGYGQCLDPDSSFLKECPWRDRAYLQHEIKLFLDPEKYGEPELWAYYADYDHVALCQLFGKMIDLPEGYPMYTLDLKQFCFHVGSPRLPEQTGVEHNALEDARHNKVMYEFLAKYAQELNDEVSRVLSSKDNCECTTQS